MIRFVVIKNWQMNFHFLNFLSIKIPYIGVFELKNELKINQLNFFQKEKNDLSEIETTIGHKTILC